MKIRTLLLSLVFWSGQLHADGTPRIVVDQAVYDFGNSAEGASVDGKFTFRNAGDGVLKVEKPDPSCGCTMAKVQPDTLKPGEKGELVFTLDLTNARGTIEKSILLPTNDPKEPKLLLKIKGEAKPLFEFSSELIYFGDVPAGQTSRESVTVKRLDGKKLTLTRIVSDMKALKTTSQPEGSTNGQAAQIIVEIAGSGAAENFSDVLSVYVDNPEKPAFLLPVAGRFLGFISIEPQALDWTVPDETHWGRTTGKSSTTAKIIVSSSRADRPLELGDFASTLEDLLVKITELEKGRRFEVLLRLDKPLKETTRARLTFETNYREQPSFDIPVTIRLEAP